MTRTFPQRKKNRKWDNFSEWTCISCSLISTYRYFLALGNVGGHNTRIMTYMFMLWLIFVITCGSFSWDEPAGVFFIVCRCISNYQDGDFIRLTCSTLPHCYACLISAFLSVYIVVFSVFSDLRAVYCIGIGQIADHHSVNSSSDTSIMNISLSTDQRGHIVFIVLVKYIHQDLDFQSHSLS